MEVVITVQINSLFAIRWNMFMHIVGGLWQYLPPKFSKKAFFDRVVSHFQEKVGSTRVLSGEHLALVVVASLDKATNKFNALLLSSVALAGHASEQISLEIVCCLSGQ